MTGLMYSELSKKLNRVFVKADVSWLLRAQRKHWFTGFKLSFKIRTTEIQR